MRVEIGKDILADRIELAVFTLMLPPEISTSAGTAKLQKVKELLSEDPMTVRLDGVERQIHSIDFKNYLPDVALIRDFEDLVEIPIGFMTDKFVGEDYVILPLGVLAGQVYDIFRKNGLEGIFSEESLDPRQMGFIVPEPADVTAPGMHPPHLIIDNDEPKIGKKYYSALETARRYIAQRLRESANQVVLCRKSEGLLVPEGMGREVYKSQTIPDIKFTCYNTLRRDRRHSTKVKNKHAIRIDEKTEREWGICEVYPNESTSYGRKHETLGRYLLPSPNICLFETEMDIVNAGRICLWVDPNNLSHVNIPVHYSGHEKILIEIIDAVLERPRARGREMTVQQAIEERPDQHIVCDVYQRDAKDRD